MAVVIDLDLARATAETWMIDRCKLLRDTQGALDDTLNSTTLEYESNPSDSTTIYGDPDGGPCLVGKEVRRENRNSEGGQTVARRIHHVRLPMSAPRALTGDIVVMVASPDVRSNPNSVGQRFRVIEGDERSFASSQIVTVEDAAGVRTR